MKRPICICVAVILLAAIPATATMTGTELNAVAISCENPDLLTNLFATGFLNGFIQGFLDTTTDHLCIPQNIRGGDIAEMVKKYLKSHQENLYLPANVLLLKVIQTAWPCKKESKP